MPDSTSKAKRPERRPSQPNLAGTRGPDPASPLAEVYLTVGILIGAHGLGGELRMKLITDDPEQLLDLKTVYLGERHRPYTIESIRFHREGALIAFAEVQDVETAETMRGLPVRISGRDARPLAEGEFYLYQVIGLTARTESGEPMGTVTDVIETGANLVLVVTDAAGKEDLFPSIPDVVIDLNPHDGYVVIRPQSFWESPA
ncbi:MAG TPA: ribosome maturation factor RimM [Thermomicrobiales bacterium]|nr:ribosome maturation factor RimM [Thermomicrobiales bacterium]